MMFFVGNLASIHSHPLGLSPKNDPHPKSTSLPSSINCFFGKTSQEKEILPKGVEKLSQIPLSKDLTDKLEQFFQIKGGTLQIIFFLFTEGDEPPRKVVWRIDSQTWEKLPKTGLVIHGSPLAISLEVQSKPLGLEGATERKENMLDPTDFSGNPSPYIVPFLERGLPAKSQEEEEAKPLVNVLYRQEVNPDKETVRHALVLNDFPDGTGLLHDPKGKPFSLALNIGEMSKHLPGLSQIDLQDLNNFLFCSKPGAFCFTTGKNNDYAVYSSSGRNFPKPYFNGTFPTSFIESTEEVFGFSSGEMVSGIVFEDWSKPMAYVEPRNPKLIFFSAHNFTDPWKTILPANLILIHETIHCIDRQAEITLTPISEEGTKRLKTANIPCNSILEWFYHLKENQPWFFRGHSPDRFYSRIHRTRYAFI